MMKNEEDDDDEDDVWKYEMKNEDGAVLTPEA